MKRILFFVKLPPPLTGATMMNKYACEDPLLKDNFIIKIIPVHYVSQIKDMGKFSLNKIFIFLRIWLLLLKTIFSFKPDIIYFQISPLGTAFIRDLAFVAAMKLSGKKIIYHLHGLGIKQAAQKNSLFKILYKFAFNNEYVICLEENLFDDIKDVYKKTPFIVNNGIIDENPDSLPKKNNETPVLLYLSNLIKSKGIYDLLEALSNINKKGISFKAIIAGKEYDIRESDLICKIDSLGLNDCVSYVGPKYGDEKIELLKNIDILVHPTKNDSWGLVILEAFQFSIPVISTYEGAIPKIIDHGVNGLLYEKGNVEQLTLHIEKMINDKSFRISAGQKAREKFIEKYTIDVFNKNIYNLFNDLLNKQK
ncbi:MAG: glycosyltransferase [Bacteroidota bacterium]|nr:glycosyltransferase [Bacteroidota bacterium]